MSDDRPLSQEEFMQEIDEGYDRQSKTNALVEENKALQAEMLNKKFKQQKKDLDKITGIQEEIENEDILNRSFSKDVMLKSIEDRKNAVIFLNKGISEHLVAAPGSLIVIPSMTNNGKSTLVAHIAEALIGDDKKVLILSNEETEEDVRARVSCLRTKVSFGDYKTNKCSKEEFETVLTDAENLARSNHLVVISPKNEADAYKVTTVDGVISTMKKADGNFDAVLLDYYTNVNMSTSGQIEPWHVNNRLAAELNILKDGVSYPIIAMAQCESIRTDKKVEDKATLDFDSNHPMYRWKGGKGILIYATDIIELVKDFENSCSYLWAHKVRFGHGNLERLHSLPFDKKMQRFIDWSAEHDAKVTASRVTRKSAEQGKELGLDKIID